MPKQTQQLVLMLIIGVLIGTTAVMVWKQGGAPVIESGEEAVYSTPTGEAGGADSVEKTSEAIRATSTGAVLSQASAWPLPPEIPANTRVGLMVADQEAGTAVNVSGLVITGKKWIGVYDDRSGAPGWIMGATRVHEGDTIAKVELLRATAAGGAYYAVILNDDGDEVFNRLSDLPPLTSDRVTIVRFKAQ
jgi:hypothetical protein